MADPSSIVKVFTPITRNEMGNIIDVPSYRQIIQGGSTNFDPAPVNPWVTNNKYSQIKAKTHTPNHSNPSGRSPQVNYFPSKY